jgi:hypothetical protein
MPAMVYTLSVIFKTGYRGRNCEWTVLSGKTLVGSKTRIMWLLRCVTAVQANNKSRIADGIWKSQRGRVFREISTVKLET